MVDSFFLLFSPLTLADDCQLSTPGMDSMEQLTISLINARGEVVPIKTHIADSEPERQAGYQFVCEEVINTSTILFFYSTPIVARFHMNNVKAPLDIGFFDLHGVLIHHEVMDIYRTEAKPIYGPDAPFQFALEARAGFFKEHQFIPGKSRLVLVER